MGSGYLAPLMPFRAVYLRSQEYLSVDKITGTDIRNQKVWFFCSDISQIRPNTVNFSECQDILNVNELSTMVVVNILNLFLFIYIIFQRK